MAGLFDRVVECKQARDFFVWRFPSHSFNPPVKLIVRESQEAVFVFNGQALDSFGPGSHTLNLPQLPLLLRALGISSERINSFRADVYFFNRADHVGMNWGTDSQVKYLDPVYELPVSIGASGSMAIAVREPRKLLVKLLGDIDELDEDGLSRLFQPSLQMQVKTVLLNTIKDKGISVYDLEAHLEELSNELRVLLAPVFAQYGIELVYFVVERIVLPDNDAALVAIRDVRLEEYRKSARVRREVGSDTTPDTANASASYCPQCGHSFESHDKYCAECGLKRS